MSADRTPPLAYDVIRLNGLSARSWAVVETPSGAIALDQNGQLIMKLTESDARCLAATLSLAIRKIADEALAARHVSMPLD